MLNHDLKVKMNKVPAVVIRKQNRDQKKSQSCLESGPYFTDFDDFGVVGKLAFRAFQRGQNRQNP